MIGWTVGGGARGIRTAPNEVRHRMLRVTAVLEGVQGAPYYSIDHYYGTTSGEADAAADATREFWFQLQNILCAPMTFRIEPEVVLVDEATGLATGSFPHNSLPFTFTDAGQPLPWTTQALLRVGTNTYLNGRRLRGRKFIPGWPETASTDGRPTVAVQNLVNTAFDAAAVIAAAAGGWVVYSTTHHDAAFISSRNTWDQWATLRSRRD